VGAIPLRDADSRRRVRWWSCRRHLNAEAKVGNLFLHLMSSHYERASFIVTQHSSRAALTKIGGQPRRAPRVFERLYR
jgi:hypothetical protein